MNFPPPSHRSARVVTTSGFSMLEVMIAIVILAVALLTMLGNIGSLGQGHKAAREEAKAAELAQLISERVMGASWADLKTNDKATWYRAATPRPGNGAPQNNPMSENAASVNDDLQQLGVITGQTGLQNVKVYLEYYKSDLFDDLAGISSNLAGRAQWLKECGDPTKPTVAPTPITTDLFFDEDPIATDLATADSAIFRVLVRWDSCVTNYKPNLPRWHELVFSRRQ